MKSRIKTAQLNFKVDPALKEAAEKAAACDQRSLTSLIEKLLTDFAREKGFPPQVERPSRKKQTSASAEMAAV
jgi:hypothetical protein